MTRTPHFLLALLAVVLPCVARAQSQYVWMGQGLPRTGANIHTLSYGVQRSPDGTSITEQPLVLSRRFDAESQWLYSAFAQGTTLTNTALRFRYGVTDRDSGSVNLASVQHQSLSLSFQNFGQASNWQISEQFGLRSTGLVPSTGPLPSGTTPYSPTTFQSLQVISAGLDKVFPSNSDSYVVAVSFGVERPVTATGTPGAGIRGLPLVISRMAFRTVGNDNALLMEAVRTRRAFPLLTLKLMANPTPPGSTALPLEWRFYDVGITSARTVASETSDPPPIEQVSFSYKRLEFVGTNGAVVTFNLVN